VRRRAVGGAADVTHFDGAVVDAVGPAVHDGGVGGREGVGGRQSALLGGLAPLTRPSSTSMNDADDHQHGRCHGNNDAKDNAKISVVVIRSTWQMYVFVPSTDKEKWRSGHIRNHSTQHFF